MTLAPINPVPISFHATIVNASKFGTAPGRYIAIPQDLFEQLVSETDGLLEAKSFIEQAAMAVDLSNTLDDVKSWHQDFDIDRGEFWPVE
jgi:hypothetical protein